MTEHELDLNDPRVVERDEDGERVVHGGSTWMEPGEFDDLDPVEDETPQEQKRREQKPIEGMVQVARCSCGVELRGRNQRQILVKFEEHKGAA